MLFPEFSENKEDTMILYFPIEGGDIRKIQDELEKTYVCFEKMGTAVKDGKKYVTMEIKDEN